ncbi:MAG: LysM peptidoglycan-binding domain-containing protein [Thermoanaerobaculia bacterium]
MNRSPILISLLALALALPAASRAQAPAAEPTAWHTVRPGETLEGIAARFLGSSRLWPEIQRLNPAINDAHWISPGQRIRVPLTRSNEPAARLDRLSREVEEQPSPIPWQQAQVGDMLVERDGVRTRRKSSAEMQFLDGARLVVTEDSLVFLRRAGAGLQGAPRKSIEIIEGQADLESRAASGSEPAAPEVEIVVGSSRATSRADRSGPAQTRARRSEEGGAKVMAYGGESEVEAGGAKVAVKRGMGTSVAAQGPPSPPEPLLPAPRLNEPEPGAERACTDPWLSWQPVPEAAAYIVEVCRDPGCGALVERRTGETGPRWRPPAPLPLGELYWRVTARSRSGLDGYPSEASRLTITSDRAAGPPPRGGTIAVAGPQVLVGERLYVSPGAKVQVTAVDAEGRPARWTPLIGGREERAWPDSWSVGEKTVAAAVVDGCGGSAAVAPVSFVVDGEAPVIQWQAGGRKELADRLAPDTEKDRQRERGRRGGGVPARDAWASDAGVFLLPLPWKPVRKGERPADTFPVEIASDHPQAFLAAPGSSVLRDGGPETALGDEILWVTATDAGAGVDRLILRTRTERDRVVLEIEAADLVGNQSRKEIVLKRGR